MQSRSRKAPAAQCREFELIFEIFIATCAGLSHYRTASLYAYFLTTMLIAPPSQLAGRGRNPGYLDRGFV